MRECGERTAAEAVKLVAQKLDLLRLHPHEGLKLSLHVHVCEALRGVGRIVLRRRLDRVDRFALEDRCLELFDLRLQRPHLCVFVVHQLVDLPHLPLVLVNLFFMVDLYLLELALEADGLGLLVVLAAAIDALLQTASANVVVLPRDAVHFQMLRQRQTGLTVFA